MCSNCIQPCNIGNDDPICPEVDVWCLSVMGKILSRVFKVKKDPSTLQVFLNYLGPSPLPAELRDHSTKKEKLSLQRILPKEPVPERN